MRLIVEKCIAEAKLQTYLEKRRAEAKAKAESEANEPKIRASEAFAKAHFDWLRAVAAIKDPEAPEEEMEEQFAAETEAERRFFSTAAAYPDQWLQKLMAFETVLGDELASGQRRELGPPACPGQPQAGHRQLGAL